MPKKIYRELTVDVVKLIFVLAVILLVNLFEGVQVIRTLGIDTFMEDKVLVFLFVDESIITVRASKL